MRKNLILFLSVFLSTISTYAQLQDPVKWTTRTEKVSDTEVNLIIDAKIEHGWHLYGIYCPDGGPVPLTVTFEKSDKYELVGKIKEVPAPKKVMDEIFMIEVQFFDNKASFIQKIKVKSATDFNINVVVDGQACLEDGMCVLVGGDYSFMVKAATVPVAETAIESDTATTTNADSSLAQSDTLTTTPTETLTESTSTEEKKGSLWKIIIEAILWGFAALLTPCVFPMVPMTVSFFMKGGENKAKGKIMASTYGLSIVILYTLPIALIIFITYFIGGESVTGDIFNWLSTHWIPNILFFLIFMIFAASFFGAFEIVMPSWMVNKADSQADRGGLIGAFFMALTLVLVSFSCTGPIVGTIIVKSTQGEIWEPIITMLAFSTAFALPFTLFAFFPSLLTNLPQSGGWLNSVKVVLGFIEVALGFKFLSVADQVYHWGLLDREVYLAIWIVNFTLLGFYLLGKIRFAHDSETKSVSVTRLSLALISFTFVVYMIPGMVGAPLKMLSGYLPPTTTHDFDLNQVIRDNTAIILNSNNGSSNSSSTDNKLCGVPKYSEFLHLPHGLKGYFDYDEGMACAKEQNKPVFIDFTGHGCVNCREMEANVWSHPEVLKKLQEEFVVIALYVDDKTDIAEEDWVTSTVDGKVKKTIGKKFADLQISKYGTNAQPYYVLLDHQGELLVTPRAYDLDVQAFIKFLDDAIAEFNKRTAK